MKVNDCKLFVVFIYFVETFLNQNFYLIAVFYRLLGQ